MNNVGFNKELFNKNFQNIPQIKISNTQKESISFFTQLKDIVSSVVGRIFSFLSFSKADGKTFEEGRVHVEYPTHTGTPGLRSLMTQMLVLIKTSAYKTTQQKEAEYNVYKAKIIKFLADEDGKYVNEFEQALAKGPQDKINPMRTLYFAVDSLPYIHQYTARFVSHKEIAE